MRRFLLAVMMCGVAAGAQAADLPDLPILRGAFADGLTGGRVNWSGVYAGGQITHGGADMDFKNSGQDLLAKLLNNIDVEAQFNISKWPVGERTHMQSSGFGAFAGYNFQWTDALIGVELNYTHGEFFGQSKGSQGRSFQFPTDYITTVNVSSSSSMRMTDFGSLRLRGGYAVGSFLPYGFVGVALGHLGRIRAGRHTLETPVGVVAVEYDGENTVSLENVPSYRHTANATVEVEGLGRVTGDIAWGGNWFFLVNEHREELTLRNVERLTDVTWRIRQALTRQGITGRDGQEIDHVVPCAVRH